MCVYDPSFLFSLRRKNNCATDQCGNTPARCAYKEKKPWRCGVSIPVLLACYIPNAWQDINCYLINPRDLSTYHTPHSQNTPLYALDYRSVFFFLFAPAEANQAGLQNSTSENVSAANIKECKWQRQ
jgi:hypothetical protein